MACESLVAAVHCVKVGSDGVSEHVKSGGDQLTEPIAWIQHLDNRHFNCCACVKTM